MSDSRLCKCGAPHDDWPGDDGGQLCQMCWEAECSASWWQMIEALKLAQEAMQGRAE